MDHITRLDFQINRLGYKFNDVNLLTEAITIQSLEKKNGATDLLQTKTLHRLSVLGDSVLKLLVCQYVIQTSGLVDEGILTSRKDNLINKRVQAHVGRQLFCPDANENGHQENNYIKTNYVRWKKKPLKVPYHLFVKSILGAIFVDAGGTHGNGLIISMNLFLKLWRDILALELDSTRTKVKELNQCFPVDSTIKHVWKVLLKPSISEVEKLLSYNFKNFELLCEALTHKSFDAYKIFPSWEELYHPNYQRLEFLGDSVLGLIITEYMFHEYPTVAHFDIVRKVTPHINDAFLRQIASQLQLKRFVRKAEQLNRTWNRTGDIMESVIGALYVDGGISKSREFILTMWKLSPSEKAMDQSSALDYLQQKIGYKFEDKRRLQAVLIHRGFQNYEDVKRRFLKDVRSGEILINLYVTDYVIRACNTKEKLRAMKARLCSEKVLRAIVGSLELQKLIQICPYQSTLEAPFHNYNAFVFAIFGAILNTVGGEAITTALEIFYRLWNPHLEHCPKRSLLEGFLLSPLEQYQLRAHLGYLIPDDDFNTIEWNIGCYKFQHRNLLEQALTQRASRSDDGGVWVKEDSTKLEFVGQCIVEFLKDSESLQTTEFDTWLEINQISAVNAWVLSCNMDLLRKYYVLQPLWGTVDLPSTISIFYSVVGAIFVDSPGTFYDKLSNVRNCYTHCMRHIINVFADINDELKPAKIPKTSTYVPSLSTSEWNSEVKKQCNSNHSTSLSTRQSYYTSQESLHKLPANNNDDYIDYLCQDNQLLSNNKQPSTCTMLVWYIMTFILAVWFYTIFVNCLNYVNSPFS